MPQTGQNYGRGVARLLEGLGAAVERKKNENADAKAIEGIMKRNPELLDEVGLDIDAFQGLSSREKVRTFQFLNEKHAIDKVKTNLAAIKEQTQQMQFNRGERQAEQQDISGALRGLQAMNMPQVQPGAVGPMGTPAMMTTPANNPNQMGAILTRLSAQFPRAAATLREEVKQQMELRQQAGPRATPGTIQRIPGLESHVFGVQSPSGAGSFLPVGGGAAAPAAARPATARDQLAAQRQIRDLEKELEALFTIAPENFTAAHRVQGENLKRQIAELRRIAGLAQPTQAGGAKEAVATGASDDPLGIFQ